MLINCNSCHKKFIVPDSAITKSGRLVQCGTCGNKWTQYPVEKKETKLETTPVIKKPESKKIVRRKKLSKLERYSDDYLMKKHGVEIFEKKSSGSTKIKKKSKSKIEESQEKSFGFYGHLILFILFVSTFLGILNLTKELLIAYYPKTEVYINYLYEVIGILNVVVIQLFNKF